MKSNITIGMVGLFLGIAAIANADPSPLANVPETWSAGQAGWTTPGDMTLASVTPGITIQFKATASDDPNVLPGFAPYGMVSANSSASSGRFVGDYSNAAVDRIAFDLSQRGIRTAVLGLKSGTRVWQCQFPVPVTTGEVVHIVIPLVFDPSTWGKNPPAGGDAVQFAQDMKSITRVVVSVEGIPSEGGYLTVNNFKLIGPWEKGQMTTDGLALAWLALNGLPSADGQADLDPDNDGFNNRAEFLAGTNPKDPDSKLVLKIDRDGNGKSVLKWNREDYRNYTVLATADLSAPFSEVGGAVVENVGTDNQCSVNDAETDAKFYRIEIK